MERIAEWRNLWKGHDGIASESDNKSRLINLEQALYDFQKIIGSHYYNILLIKPKSTKLIGGIYHHEVESILGTRTPFRAIEIKLKVPIDNKNLYLLDKEFIDNLPIELVPFIRIMGSPSDAKNACYFYNRISGNNIRWISYHFAKKSESVHPDNELLAALSLIRD